MYTASVDLVMEIEACALLQHGKGHFLYSAIIAKLKMNYSHKAGEDDVVDSPPSGAIIPIAINLPSSLWGKGTGESSKSKCQDTNGE